MQSEKQLYSWRISVQAKAKNFYFRFRSTSFGPNWTLHRFSFILKLRKPFVFTLNSDRRSPIAPQSRLGFVRTRVINAIQRFRARFNKKNLSDDGETRSIRKHPKVLIRVGFLVLWFASFVSRIIWKNDPKGFVIFGSVGLMIALWMKKTRKFFNVRVLWIIATVGCLILSDFDSYLEAWNKIGGISSLLTSS